MACNISDTKQIDLNQQQSALSYDCFDELLVALRRISRAIDLHSRRLAQTHGLTGPQALVLKEAVGTEGITAGALAKNISLSQATVTDILKRLESRGLLQRIQSVEDRRRVIVHATENGRKLLATSPPLLQEIFSERFNGLKDWEQNLLLASVQRLAELMDAEELDAAPILSSGDVLATAQAVSEVVAPGDSDKNNN